jgi:hypothetical protein
VFSELLWVTVADSCAVNVWLRVNDIEPASCVSEAEKVSVREDVAERDGVGCVRVDEKVGDRVIESVADATNEALTESLEIETDSVTFVKETDSESVTVSVGENNFESVAVSAVSVFVDVPVPDG